MSEREHLNGLDVWPCKPDTAAKNRFYSNLSLSGIGGLEPFRLVGKIAHIEATYLLNEQQCSFELFAPVRAVSRDIDGNVVLIFDCPLAPEHSRHGAQGRLLYVRYPGQLTDDWQAVVDEEVVISIKKLTVQR